MKSIFIKMTFLIFLLSSISIFSAINFHQINFSEIFKKAKIENKPVLLYFHFDKCGGCIQMNKTTFKDSTVLDFLSKNYIFFDINTSTQEGKKINETYNIKGFPTFLFLDDKENIFHKIAGFYETKDFLKHLKKALEQRNTLSYYEKEYKNGNRDPEFLYNYCYKLHEACELKPRYVNEYLDTQNYLDLHDTNNLKFLFDFAYYNHKNMIPYKSDAYSFIVNYWPEMNFIAGAEQSKARLVFMINRFIDTAIVHRDHKMLETNFRILAEYSRKEPPYFFKLDGRPTGLIKPKYLAWKRKLEFYEKNNLLESYKNFSKHYIELIWNDITELNNFAWKYADKFNNKQDLTKAKNWIERSIELEKKYYNLDTYAFIMMKLRYLRKALQLSEEAIMLAEKSNVEDISSMIELREKIKEILAENGIEQ